MKITYLLGSVGKTGGNIVLFQHMEALAKRGHTVIMLTPYDKKEWVPGTLNDVMKSRDVGYKGIWSILKSIQRWLKKHFSPLEKRLSSLYVRRPLEYANWITVRLVNQWEPSDITIATHSYTAHAAALLSDRTRAYYHMQGYEPWFTDNKESQEISLLSYHYPINKIANCKWLHDKISSIKGESIGLVRPGLNHDIFKPLRDIEEKYTNVKEIHIVSYADDRPLKGWNESLKAMEVVFARFSENNRIKIKWSVFGSIINYKTSIPIHYHGYLSHQELAELYSNAHIVFIPSWFESFPLQPIEAMACGAAVCTTKIGTEDYAKDGETAIVIPPKDIDALSNSIIGLIQNPEKMHDLVKNGVIEARKFNWKQSAQELMNVLNLADK